jgi:hypothetical protein
VLDGHELPFTAETQRRRVVAEILVVENHETSAEVLRLCDSAVK